MKQWLKIGIVMSVLASSTAWADSPNSAECSKRNDKQLAGASQQESMNKVNYLARIVFNKSAKKSGRVSAVE
jgi:hypothetical protein